jgi:hypothetical protein
MSFFDSFTGASQRRDMSRANRQANNALAQGYGQQQQRYDQAAGMFDPFVQQGQAANAFYGNALGLGGQEAQGQAINTLTGNPLFQGQLANDSNAVMRQLNARGQSGGGLANVAGQRVFQQTAGNWLDRYRDAGRDGFQATNQQAGVRMNQGDNAMGYGATRAGQSMNYGNALASTRSTAMNNITGLLGTGLQAYNAFRQPQPPRRDVGGGF